MRKVVFESLTRLGVVGVSIDQYLFEVVEGHLDSRPPRSRVLRAAMGVYCCGLYFISRVVGYLGEAAIRIAYKVNP